MSVEAVFVAKCPHGCRGELRWIEDQWWCPKCGDEWPPEVAECEADGTPMSIDDDGPFCDTCRNSGREPPPGREVRV